MVKLKHFFIVTIFAAIQYVKLANANCVRTDDDSDYQMREITCDFTNGKQTFQGITWPEFCPHANYFYGGSGGPLIKETNRMWNYTVICGSDFYREFTNVIIRCPAKYPVPKMLMDPGFMTASCTK